MDPNSSGGSGAVQYDRWNEDNINMDVEASQSTVMRLYSRLCVGPVGLVLKACGVLAVLVTIYLIGYVTGYYVHRC